MIIKKEKKITFTLILTKEEANWLHDYMQNQMTETETQKDKDMRKKFFEATSDSHTI